MHTPDFTDENIARLAELFPNCVTESKDDNGNLNRAIDFDQLRQELSGSIVEGPQERYHLDWPGKREALLTANAPIAKTLRPSREESVDFDTTKNLFIEGDNLDALKLLQETYLGKVKMIYIDPPYNTGKEFMYADDFAEDKDAYFERSMQKDNEGNRLAVNTESNGRFHSDWLSMIFPRLKLARNLLREEGVIFISIDDNEQANFKRLCDEVFGEDNFVATLVWQKRYSRENRGSIGDAHEYVVVYAKSISEFSNTSGMLPLTEEQAKIYTNPNSDPRGRWRGIPMTAQGYRPNQMYKITTPTGVVHTPPEGRCWSTIETEFRKLEAAGRVYFGKDNSSQPQIIRYLTEVQGMTPWTWLPHGEGGHTDEAKKEIYSLLGKGCGFDTPKPTRLILHLLRIASRDKDFVVVDFFAGSGTTSHAVMAMNIADGGSRSCISVQIPEKCETGGDAALGFYGTIAEIGKERIRRAGKKIKEEAGLMGANLDIGFRVLKVDTSNMKDVYYSPDSAEQRNLLDQVGNIKEDRTSEDLLFQVLLDWGVDLALPISKETVSDRTVFFVDNNALVACFDTGIDEDFVKQLANRKPLRVVFRDSGFASDAAKINVEQIFKLISPTTEVKSV